MRSLSLTRSSAAPRTSITDPSGRRVPSAPRAGSSSMTEGTSDGSTREAARLAGRDRHPADRLAGFLVFDRHVDRRPRRGAGSRAGQSREGLRPTPSMWMTLPGRPAARAPQNAAPEMSPGTLTLRPCSRWPPREPDRQAVTVERYAERGQCPLRMIPCCGGLDDDGLARRMEAGQQHAALHLCAGDVGPVGDALKRGALDRQRRPPVVRMDGRPHFGQRGDDPAHRPAGQRRVADDGRAERVRRGQPRQQPHRGAGIGGVDRT